MKSGWNDETIEKRLKEILAFSFMTEEELHEIVELAEFYSYEEGEEIIRQGERDQKMYAVIDGSVQVSVHDSERGDVYICTIGSGELFGEAGMFIKVNRTASVYSCGESRLFSIDRSGLINFIKKRPKTGNKMLMVIIYSLLRKLREANQELAFERRSDIVQDDIDSIINAFSS